MKLAAGDPARYLGEDDVLDFSHPSVQALTHALRASAASDVEFAKAAFEYVRDEVAHSWDVQDPRVTVSASEVLSERVGLCYAKAHLLAAVLRAEGVPTGLCYQRLTGERDYREVFTAPSDVVLAALRQATDVLDLYRRGLPQGL